MIGLCWNETSSLQQRRLLLEPYNAVSRVVNNVHFAQEHTILFLFGSAIREMPPSQMGGVL
jgi:hypothetical protein